MSNYRIIYGKNTVTEAIKNSSAIEVYVVSESKSTNKNNNKFDNKYSNSTYDKSAYDNSAIEKLAQSKKIDIKYISKVEMAKMANGNHQGVCAKVFEYKYFDVNELVTDKNDSLIIALDGLEDPHNLGAIIRTCEISGCDGVIIPKNRSVHVTNTVAKVSTGATEYVKVSEVTNLRQTLKNLKDKGYWIVGAEATSESVNFWNVDFNMKICLVIGSEGKGVSRIVREECDYLVKIPMWGKINSLNASVSAAILIYEIRRQQNIKK